LLSDNDLDFISDGFTEAHKTIGIPMKYIPFDSTNSKKNNQGRWTIYHLEAEAITIYGLFKPEEYDDADLNEGDIRIDAKIQVVKKQIKDAGYVLKEKDAFDIVDDEGNTVRYLVVGFDKDVELNKVFKRAKVTEFEKRFSDDEE
jgi:hypothetical protein